MRQMTIHGALLAFAAVFAVVTGANDGGSLLAAGLKLVSMRVAAAGVVVVAFVAAGPLVFGTRVATTFAHHLVAFSGSHAQAALLVAVLAAIVVAATLTVGGLPTSLTLAVIGAIAGSGFGYGLPVSWRSTGLVLAVGMAAPLAGAGLAYAIGRLLWVVPVRASAARVLRRWHRVAFGLQCLAYSVNDGQKMLAVFALAAGATAGSVAAASWHLLAIAGLFALGMLLGLPRIARSLDSGVLAVRASHVVAAELAAAGAVLGTAAAGLPVSMTQALAGGLVGAGVSEGYGRVRWDAAGRILLAWIFTLPASFALGAAVSGALRAW